MALVVECHCLGASQLPLHPLFPHHGLGPSLTLCTVGQPLPTSMGRFQSQVIGEVVAPVALLSGIALSPENFVRYGRHCRKNVISLRSPSLVLLVLGLPRPSPLLGSSSGPVTAKRSLCGISPPRPPPGPCSLLIGWSLLLLSHTQWLSLIVGDSDLPPQPLTGHASISKETIYVRWTQPASGRISSALCVLCALTVRRTFFLIPCAGCLPTPLSPLPCTQRACCSRRPS